MIIIIDHSVDLDGYSNAIYNSLFQFIITRRNDKYEIVIYGDSKSFNYYKKLFKSSVFNINIVFIPKSNSGLRKLNDYCNVKCYLLGDSKYFYISHDLNLISFLVSDKYKGIGMARDMYDVCLYTRKGALTGMKSISLTEPYITQLLHKSIKRAFNLVRYELYFLYQDPVDDSFLLSIGEKERLLKVSFEKYKFCLNDYLKDNKNISKKTREYIDVRLDYVNRFEAMLKVYDKDTNKSDVYLYYSFYLYLICQNLYDSKKYSLCVSTSIRILETYLTGYLISTNRAKPDASRIKLYKYNRKRNRNEWIGAGGFGNVWEIFLDEFPLSLDQSLSDKVDKVKDLRNKCIYGHGYLPLTSSSAKLSIATVMEVIELIEKNISSRSVFRKMKRDWVYFDKAIQQEVLLDSFTIS